MARRTASAKWAAGPALDGWRVTLLGLGLNEGLDRSFRTLPCATGVSKPAAENLAYSLLPTVADSHDASGRLYFGLAFMTLLTFLSLARLLGPTSHLPRPSASGAS